MNIPTNSLKPSNILDSRIPTETTKATQKAIADRIAGIQEYCLSCLSTQGEYSVIPPKNTDSDEEDCAAYQSGNEADANGTLNAILNSIHNSLSFVEPVISRTSSTHSVSSNNSIKSLHSMNGVPTPTNSPRDSEQQDTPDLRACSPSP